MKRLIHILLTLLMLSLVTGCWSNRDIEKLAIVTIAGIDKVTVDGKGKYQYSANVMNPQGTKTSQSGDSSGKGQDGVTEVYLSGEGDTVQSTARMVTLRTPRHPYFGQMKALVIGEDLAKEGVGQIMELFTRSPEMRWLTFFMIAKGEARDVLQAKPEIDPTISDEISKIAEDKVVKIGVSHGVTLADFLQTFLAEDRTAVASAVEIETLSNGDKKANLKGMAVFRKDKLAGWLETEETLGYLLVNNFIKNCQTPVVVKEDDKNFLTYLLNEGKCKITPQVEGDNLSFEVKLQTKGQIQDVSGFDVTQESIKDLEVMIGERIKEIVEKSFAKAKELDSDYIGLAASLHRQNPALWKELQPRWDAMLPNVTVNVEVESKITKVGETTKNIKYSY